MESFSERMGVTTKNFLKYDEIDEPLSNRMWNLIEKHIILSLEGGIPDREGKLFEILIS